MLAKVYWLKRSVERLSWAELLNLSHDFLYFLSMLLNIERPKIVSELCLQISGSFGVVDCWRPEVRQFHIRWPALISEIQVALIKNLNLLLVSTTVLWFLVSRFQAACTFWARWAFLLTNALILSYQLSVGVFLYKPFRLSIKERLALPCNFYCLKSVVDYCALVLFLKLLNFLELHNWVNEWSIGIKSGFDNLLT